MVKPDHWQQVSQLYHAALAKDPNERGRFLAQTCEGDDALRREVESLLAHEGTAEGFLTAPALEMAAKVMAEDSGGSLSGRQIGSYQILSRLGAGGMGEVYRARDAKLNRDIALKVLPELFALDRDRLARFKREAQLLASLNHPNIAAIYGFEESGGVRGLVMELVEGEDLSQRIARGAISIDEALPIAKQIADALEAAHEQGIIHRDLKPANIKVRPDGTVKVLDFGLAKAMEPTGAMSASVSMSPTITTPAMTKAGVILGTAAYMSPEQARGTTVDKRADLWAFGVVLWEMLTGKRLFEGATVSDTLGAVLKTEPQWNALAPATPSAIRRLLRRCLEKDRKRRLDSASAARLEIEEALTSPSAGDGAAVQSGPAPRSAWMTAFTVAAVLAAALAIPAVRYLRQTPPPAPPETRLDIVTPATDSPTSFALSPDGRQIVFVASGEGASRLWLRSLSTTTAQPLAGTEGATYPFWSPDGRSIGFFAGGALKRLDIGGGLPQTLANVTDGRGGTWSADSVILFAPTPAGPLSRVPAGGGEVVALTKLSAGHVGHRLPQFLPGGRQFLFYASGAEEAAGIYLGSLDAPDVKRVTAAETAGAYAPPGWLFFAREGTLVARRFDAARGELTGDPITIADHLVSVDSALRMGAFSVSATGLVTYRTGGTGPKQLTWFDRAGKPLGTLGAPDETQFDPTLSPDGLRVAVSRTVQRNTDIWLIDAARTTRFTFDPSPERFQRWSPDGSRIVFSKSKNRDVVYDLYQKPSNGAGTEALLLESPQSKWALSWSSDGRSLLYGALFPKTGFDQWVLPIAGDPKPFPFLNSTFREGLGVYSPDGHWVAYQSNESGRDEIYVRPFPGPGGRWQVSTAGGGSPRWRPDGKEVYYVAPGSRLMAVPLGVKGAALEPGLPTALFQPRIALGGANFGVGYQQQYDVASDGRFLINVTTDEGSTAPITLIENWKPSN